LKEVAASLDCSTTAVRHHFLILYGAEYEALTRGGGRQPGPVETVRQLYAEGNTPAEIAHKLGYATANPIHIMLRGTPEKRAKKAAQEEKFDNFERLHSKGFSPAEIADILNVSRHSVAIWLRRHGYVANRPRLQGRRPKHSDLPGWKLRHWRLQQGLTQAQVQEKTGITNWSAYECGRKPITQSMAMRLQKLLDG
jgi:transcriptional regulator with XRE-family HTH domain